MRYLHGHFPHPAVRDHDKESPAPGTGPRGYSPWSALTAVAGGLLGFLLATLTAIVAFSSCASPTDGSSPPRPALEVTVNADPGIIAFVRSAPFQNVHVAKFGASGRLRVIDLTSGLVLWQVEGNAGEVVVLTDGEAKCYASGTPLPLSASQAFGGHELVQQGETLVCPEFGLVFQ